MLLKFGTFNVAVTVTVQSPMSAFDQEFTEKVLAFGVAAGVEMVSHEHGEAIKVRVFTHEQVQVLTPQSVYPFAPFKVE